MQLCFLELFSCICRLEGSCGVNSHCFVLVYSGLLNEEEGTSEPSNRLTLVLAMILLLSEDVTVFV